MNGFAIFSFEKSSLHFPYGLKVQAAFKDGALHSIHINCPTKHIRPPQGADSGQKQPALFRAQKNGVETNPHQNTHTSRGKSKQTTTWRNRAGCLFDGWIIK
jgi:hypothetical protein